MPRKRPPATGGAARGQPALRKPTPPPALDLRARQPRQVRGEERVSAILDAAAALLQEAGPAGVTVHGIAERAATSIGSFYHFFPGLDSVFVALVDRYTDAMEAAAKENAGRSDAEWRRLSAAEAVEATFDPITRLLARHGYVTALRAVPAISKIIDEREQAVHAQGHLVIGQLLRARYPHLPGPARAAAVAVFLGTLRGGFASGRHLSQRVLLPALKRALTAQLEALETT